MKTIRDAVLGDISFDRSEIAIVDTPAFQRLRGIKQLGTSSLVFPTAVHTRFEHSLGTCWLAKQILDRLARLGRSMDYQASKTIKLATLLHDITHVPFGHTFEDERRLFDRHDEDESRLTYFLSQPGIAGALSEAGVAHLVHAALTRSDAVPMFVRQFVSGSISPDLLDYLRRDAFHCGLAQRYDDRLFQLFDLAGDMLVVKLHKNGALRRDALSELLNLLQMRYSLTERVYYHHAKVASGAMISRALELALERGVLSRETLYTLRDDVLLYLLEQAGPKVPGLADVINDLQSRRLYRPAYLLTLAGLGRRGIEPAERDSLAAEYHFQPKVRRAAEQRIAENLGVPESHVIIYCPSPRMALKEADVPVELASGNVVRLADLEHPDVNGLKAKHSGIWKFFVFLRRSDGSLHDAASTLCEETFGHANAMKQPR